MNTQTTIHPFNSIQSGCSKCGNGTVVPAIREAVAHAMPAGMPMMGLTQHLGGAMQAVTVRYCPGGKELAPELPEASKKETQAEVIRSVLPLVLDYLRGSAAGPNICAGVTEDHLHAVCICCRHEWLVETQEQAGERITEGAHA